MMDWNLVIQLVFPGILSAIFGVFAYFYSRNYREQRDFRTHMYEITNELDKNLSRNCTLTQNISDSIAVIPELRERVARLEGTRQ